MTEIEIHSQNLKKIKEYDKLIDTAREHQLLCAINDNIGRKIWADEIKKLKAERAHLDQSGRYTRFTLFTQVVKTYLTKEQYSDCWDRVEQILENPSLLQ